MQLSSSVLVLVILATSDGTALPRPYKIGEWVDVAGPAQIVVSGTPAIPGFTLFADHDPDYAGPLPEDFLLLKLPDPRGGPWPPVDLRLQSRDGKLQVAFADLTGDGVEELITICHLARSNDPRDEILQVWLWNYRPLSRIFDVLVRGNQSGPWWDTPMFRDVNGDGVLDIELTRGDSGSVKPVAAAYLLPPAGGSAVYSFDSAERKMKPMNVSTGTSRSPPE